LLLRHEHKLLRFLLVPPSFGFAFLFTGVADRSFFLSETTLFMWGVTILLTGTLWLFARMAYEMGKTHARDEDAEKLIENREQLIENRSLLRRIERIEEMLHRREHPEDEV